MAEDELAVWSRRAIDDLMGEIRALKQRVVAPHAYGNSPFTADAPFPAVVVDETIPNGQVGRIRRRVNTNQTTSPSWGDSSGDLEDAYNGTGRDLKSGDNVDVYREPSKGTLRIVQAKSVNQGEGCCCDSLKHMVRMQEVLRIKDDVYEGKTMETWLQDLLDTYNCQSATVVCNACEDSECPPTVIATISNFELFGLTPAPQMNTDFDTFINSAHSIPIQDGQCGGWVFSSVFDYSDGYNYQYGVALRREVTQTTPSMNGTWDLEISVNQWDPAFPQFINSSIYNIREQTFEVWDCFDLPKNGTDANTNHFGTAGGPPEPVPGIGGFTAVLDLPPAPPPPDPLPPAKVRWMGTWSAGTYRAYDMVIDEEYIAVANAETTNKPQTAGTPHADWDIVYDPTA